MIEKAPFLSICIPSYNRPVELKRLLDSVDCAPDEVEVIICEDHSAAREKINQIVCEYKKHTSYPIYYFENETNLGYDGNIRNLVSKANGQFIIFMGDDDVFISGTLNKYLEFLKEYKDCKYILRSYIAIHDNGKVEKFQYLPATTLLQPGEDSVAWLYKRSVSLSGFTIDRVEALKVATNDLDGTLLYQIYLMAEVCMSHQSVYCEFPVTQAWQTFRADHQMFGNSEAERSRFKPGSVSFDNSINFTKCYFEVAAYLDKKHGTSLENKIKIQLSKYSYPFLSIQRKRGLRPFLSYANRLDKELGFGITEYFYIYKWSLALLGERVCDKIIIYIKKLIGHTPDF